MDAPELVYLHCYAALAIPKGHEGKRQRSNSEEQPRWTNGR